MKQIQIKQLIIAAAFLIFSAAVFVLLFSIGSDIQKSGVYHGEQIIEVLDVGMFDVRDIDLDTTIADIAAHLFEFYPNKWLAPDEIDGHTPEDYAAMLAADYSTARMRILVHEGEYMIYGKTPEYASEIFINGELRATFGHIDVEDSSNNIYRTDLYSLSAHPVDGIIEIVMRNASGIRPAGDYYWVEIASYDLLSGIRLTRNMQIFTILSTLVTGAVFFLGYSLFIPSARANLWFALLTLIVALRIAVVDKTALMLFPGVDYRFNYMAENVTLLLISVLETLYLSKFFAGSVPRLLVKIIIGVNALLAIALISLPIAFTAGYIMVNLIVMFATAFVLLGFIVRHIRQFREEHIVSFAGQLLFIFFGLAEVRFVQFLRPLFGTAHFLHMDYSIFGMYMFTAAQMLALILYNRRSVRNEQMLASEKAMLEKQNAMKTELFGNISHELKTPLTVISNVSQLTAQCTGDSYIQEKMDIVITETERMKAKINQLLNIAKLDSDTGTSLCFEQVNIPELIRDTVNKYFSVLDEHNNKLITELPADLPCVRADKKHISEVIINLVENAIRHTHDGTITIRAALDGDFATVTVEDDGCGIAPGQAERIFERFYRGDSSTGTGLGLYICKKTVEAHGGTISAQSEPGSGTMVRFTLPVC